MPGSVLVAGRTLDSAGGQIHAIYPDESTHLIFGPSAQLRNPNSMVFDSAGRLLVNDNNGAVYEINGGTESLLFSLPLSAAI